MAAAYATVRRDFHPYKKPDRPKIMQRPAVIWSGRVIPSEDVEEWALTVSGAVPLAPTSKPSAKRCPIPSLTSI